MSSSRRALFVLLVFGLFLSQVAEGQEIDRTVLNSTVWITYRQPIAKSAQRSRSGHNIKDDDAVFGGTGFLIFQGIGYTKGQIYLVTNKHVLPKEGRPNSIQIRVAVRDQSGKSRIEEVSIPIVGSNGKYLNTVRLHPDPNTDVAVVNITPAAFGAKLQLLVDAIMTHKCLDLSMLMSSARLQSSNIGPGTPVYVVGFPAALFDPRNVSPIVRVGYVSTDPREGFTFNKFLREKLHVPEHINGFLLDANVYPGASGSLVLLAPDVATETGPGDKNLESVPTVLGIVAGSIPIFDESLRSYERIGLGVVYSADTIRQVIQMFDQPSH